MPVYDMNPKGLIEGFINERVTEKGLDGRTEKAYRLDLEHFCVWLEERQAEEPCGDENLIAGVGHNVGANMNRLEDWMELYLDYLAVEKKLKFATVCRKSRVFSYYLSYLAGHGIIARRRALRSARRVNEEPKDKGLLSKGETDAFFMAMNREYEELDSEFRKRICLRDMVMMELLFYHKIEISELLRLDVADYDRETGMLTIRRKRGEDSQVYLFSQELRRKMKEWLAEREEFQRDGECAGRMFLSKFGKPLSMKMVIKIFDKYREMAGIEKEFTPKDLKENCMKQYARELVMERCR